MCGFAGIYKYDVVKPMDVSSVKAMAECISHRGPDDSGLFVCFAFEYQRG